MAKLPIRRNKIKIDLTNVSSISSESILYLLSFGYYLKKKYNYLSLRGNLPKNEQCKQFMIECGFSSHVRFDTEFIQQNKDILSIQSGKTADTDIAEKVVEFFKLKTGKARGQITKSIYTTIMELMVNTVDHAYDSPNQNIRNDWWLIAFYIQEDNKIEFAFLDNGVGIPKTLNKKLKEKINEFLLHNNHYLLSESALNGKLQEGINRSRTKEENRGNGLPKIKSFFSKGLIKELIILSDKGYINMMTKEQKDIENNFKGTLFRWSF
ncbi:MAG: hypothetical protein IPL26_26275 [Leptospiraceae bacterium]|nr:hypothetical protein [Leptospiraceae bacterium]